MPALKPLADQVVVITGASSGIGLATAIEAGRRGGRVVLAARTRAALMEATDRVKQAGGEAMFVEADVANRGDVERIAEQALARFGRIDTWINDAGVLVVGKIGEVPVSDMRQLFEVNFWGTVYGSEVALRHLASTGGGAIINVASVESDRALPLHGIYAASKHAVKGFTDALRMEIEADGLPISVTLVKPASVGTPMPQHARTYADAEPRLPPPVYEPEEVALTILKAAERPVRDAFVGGAGRMISSLGSAAPRVADWISEKFLATAQFGDRAATPGDNLLDGSSGARVRGDHQGAVIRPSLYSKASRHPGAAWAAIGTAAVAGLGGMLLARRRRQVQLREAGGA